MSAEVIGDVERLGETAAPSIREIPSSYWRIDG
jgi:hypothetical protein